MFEFHFELINDESFLLPKDLQDPVAFVYSWPSMDSYGKDEVIDDESGCNSYYTTLGGLADHLIYSVYGSIFFHVQCAKLLEKSNSHRAIRFCVHTIPNFGDAKNCSQMVLEMVHRVLKSFLKRSMHFYWHLSASETSEGRNLLGVIYSLYRIWDKGTDKEQELSEVGLRHFLLGPKGLEIDDTTFTDT